MLVNFAERVFRLVGTGAGLITLWPSRVTVGPVVKKIQQWQSRIRESMVHALHPDIGCVVTCEGKHPKRSWKKAIIAEVVDDFYGLRRLEPNAEIFYRSREQVSFDQVRSRPQVSHRCTYDKRAPPATKSAA